MGRETKLSPSWRKLRPCDIRPGHVIAAAQIPGQGASIWDTRYTVEKTHFTGDATYPYKFRLPGLAGDSWWSVLSNLDIYVLPHGDPEDGPYGP